MKNIGMYLGSTPTAVFGVIGMVNWNPWTLSFWSTILGIILFTTISGLVGMWLIETLKDKYQRWIGRKYLKG